VRDGNQYAADVQEPSPEAMFAATMRDARKEHGMTQAQLSEQLRAEHGVEIDPTGILRIEKGQRSPRLGEAVAIADVLDIQLWMLVRAPWFLSVTPRARAAEAERLSDELQRVDAQIARADADASGAQLRGTELRRRRDDLQIRLALLMNATESDHDPDADQ
jgi:transcriptional regulator with XRE-family HTH domain